MALKFQGLAEKTAKNLGFTFFPHPVDICHCVNICSFALVYLSEYKISRKCINAFGSEKLTVYSIYGDLDQ